MTTNTYPAFPPARKDPRQVANTLKRTINFGDSDIAAATFANSLPSGAFITRVIVEVVTAFNAGATNTLTVGTNASSYNNIVASADIVGNGTASIGTQVVDVSRGLGRSLANAGDTAVFAKYASTGAAPTTGQAVIVIEYEGGNLS